MRCFIHLSYNGAQFHGWQNQPNAVSVQQTIEEALTKVMRTPMAIVGAGRTDTGVNARMMMAHADFPHPLSHDDTVKISRALNSLVGPDIAIHSLIPVDDNAHARFDATSRTYHYYVHHGKNPFRRKFSLEIAPLDYEAMNAAAAKLIETEDFTSFAKLHSDAKTNICRVSEARWMPIEDTGATLLASTSEAPHVFVITADRFLRNMVRAVTGTLIDVGRGKISVEEFERIIERRDRCAAGTSMPPHPLFLWNITYPYPLIPSKE